MLVVEDEPRVRELAVEILVDAGYAVLSAADGPRRYESCKLIVGASRSS